MPIKFEGQFNYRDEFEGECRTGAGNHEVEEVRVRRGLFTDPGIRFTLRFRQMITIRARARRRRGAAIPPAQQPWMADCM